MCRIWRRMYVWIHLLTVDGEIFFSLILKANIGKYFYNVPTIWLSTVNMEVSRFIRNVYARVFCFVNLTRLVHKHKKDISAVKCNRITHLPTNATLPSFFSRLSRTANTHNTVRHGETIAHTRLYVSFTWRACIFQTQWKKTHSPHYDDDSMLYFGLGFAGVLTALGLSIRCISDDEPCACFAISSYSQYA